VNFIYVLGYRVKIEQVFGIIKNVFSSLKNLRIRVDDSKGHKRACEWISACIILYNLLQNNHAFQNETLENAEETEEETCNEVNNIDVILGENKRELLLNWVHNL